MVWFVVTAFGAAPVIGPPVVHAAAVLTVTRGVEVVLWPDPFAHPSGAVWATTFTTPPTFDPSASAFRWDGDPVALNVVGHGLMGAELYYRPRRCGWSVAGAAAFTVLASVTWEYAFEGNVRSASAQDLVYTPLAGFVLGELRHRLVRRLGDDHRLWTTLLDPFGEAERRLGAAC